MPPSRLPAAAVATLLVATLAGCDASPERVSPVGRTASIYHDPSRPAWDGAGPRPLVTTLWYPAESGSSEVPWRIGVFRAGWSALGAPAAESGTRRPLIVLSHGTGGAAAQLSWLAEALATHGYLVAGVNHHGNTAAEDTLLPQGFALWWERARDVSAVVDALLADPRFGPGIDTTRIAVGGFSLGATTALVVAGARFDRARWEARCAAEPEEPGCAPPPEAAHTRAELEAILASDSVAAASLRRAGASYRDGRIRAAFLIAPVLGTALDPESLRGIDLPLRIVVGAADDQAVPETTARPVAAAVSGASLDVLPAVGHYTFLAPCTLRGRLFVRALCADGAGVDRAEVHRRVAAEALAFFDGVLRP
jgi:predicted dienelactone hydrolase